MKISFGYIRSSTVRPSLSEQEEALTDFSFHDILFFKDSALSDNRSGFLKLIEKLKSTPEADLFLYDLKSIDSCFSSLANFLEFLVLMEKSKIKLHCLDEKLPDVFTPSVIQEIFERVSKDLHREHMQASILKRKTAGLSVGRPSQRDDSSIQSLRKSGLTYREIAQQLKVSIGMVQRGLKT